MNKKEIRVSNVKDGDPTKYRVEVDSDPLFSSSVYNNFDDALTFARQLRFKYKDHSVRSNCTHENSFEENAKSAALKQLGAP